MLVRSWCVLVLQGMQVQGEEASIGIKQRMKLTAQFLILLMLLQTNDPNLGNYTLASRTNSGRV